MASSPPDEKPSLAMLVLTIIKPLAPISPWFLFHKLGISSFLFKAFRKLYDRLSSQLTLVVGRLNDLSANQIYSAAEVYLRSKRLNSATRLIVSKDDKQKSCTLSTEHEEDVVVDDFQGIRLRWKFTPNGSAAGQQPPSISKLHYYESAGNRRSDCSPCYELSFHKKHKDKVLNSYLPYVLEVSKGIIEENKVIKLHTISKEYPCPQLSTWSSITLDHPVTFEKLAMDSEIKKTIIEDLERFVKRKDFYRRVGKPWKRGYLLYGPPGTGKSSLIAAMANYLKFDIYDLELTDVRRNSDLKRLLIPMANRSILVVEDIDCSLDFTNLATPRVTAGKKQEREEEGMSKSQVTLSGMLNFMDGLWSSCGDQRIIVFTTNQKSTLDPALVRPGRMDLHIHMSYCTPCGFRLLAHNYLQVEDHPTFFEIEGLLGEAKVTPAQVAEQLMKNDDPDIALEDLVRFLHQKHQHASDHVV